MTLRSGHGTGAGVPRIEVLPADELPAPNPTAVPVAVSGAPPVRRDKGKFADPEAAKIVGDLGRAEQARRRAEMAERTRLLRALGLTELTADHIFYAYETAGGEFAEKHIATLASMFDGVCGEGPASIVKTAGIQLAASRFFYDEGKLTGDAKKIGEASKQGDASRQNILAAYEIQVREAQARAKSVGLVDGQAPPGMTYVDEPADAEAKP